MQAPQFSGSFSINTNSFVRKFEHQGASPERAAGLALADAREIEAAVQPYLPIINGNSFPIDFSYQAHVNAPDSIMLKHEQDVWSGKAPTIHLDRKRVGLVGRKEPVGDLILRALGEALKKSGPPIRPPRRLPGTLPTH